MNYEMYVMIAHTDIWFIWILLPCMVITTCISIFVWGEMNVEKASPFVGISLALAVILIFLLFRYDPEGTIKTFCTKEKSANGVASAKGVLYKSPGAKICIESKKFVAIDGEWHEVVEKDL